MAYSPFIFRIGCIWKNTLFYLPFPFSTTFNYSSSKNEYKIKSSFTNTDIQRAETVPSTKILILDPYVWEEQERFGSSGYGHTVYTEIADYLKSLKDENGLPVYDVHRVVTREEDMLWMDSYFDPNAPFPNPNDLAWVYWKFLFL